MTDYAINNSYQVTPQGGFYYVMSQNYQMPNYEDMIRIYINCMIPENIAISKLQAKNA